jgi:hypothetical protein
MCHEGMYRQYMKWMVRSPGTFSPSERSLSTHLPGFSFYSFILLACAECDDSLPFSRPSYIPVCYILFSVTLLHQLFFHPPSIPLKSFISAALSLVISDLFHNHIIAPQFYVGMYLIRKNTYVWTVPYCSQHVCPHKNLLGHLCYAYLRSLQPSKKLKTGSTRQ